MADRDCLEPRALRVNRNCSLGEFAGVAGAPVLEYLLFFIYSGEPERALSELLSALDAACRLLSRSRSSPGDERS